MVTFPVLAVRHKTRSKFPFRKPLVKGRKYIAPEIFKSDTCAQPTQAIYHYTVAEHFGTAVDQVNDC